MTSSAYHYNAKDLQAETPRGNPLGHPALPKCPAELARLHQLPAGDQPVDQWAGPRRLQALPDPTGQPPTVVNSLMYLLSLSLQAIQLHLGVIFLL